MVKAKYLLATAVIGIALAFSTGVASADWRGLFDVGAREVALRHPDFAAIRNACLAIEADPKWVDLPPLQGLVETKGYGSDNSAEEFSWAVMILTSRTLAGDAAAASSLETLLNRWSSAKAFEKTEEVDDAYYALKRQLLPLAIAYQVLEPRLNQIASDNIRNWIDPLVRRVDRMFDGDVDYNNHRVLADSVLAVWGSIIGDEVLMTKGLSGYHRIMMEIRTDGTLPLEARRGSRALWYQRQTLSSLAVLNEIAMGKKINLLASRSTDGLGLSTLLGALENGISSPILATVYSAENHIPGPEKNYLAPDLSFLTTRGHGRHYMAWIEATTGHDDGSLSSQRLASLFSRTVKKQRPLIDEFSGGNATCFWGRS